MSTTIHLIHALSAAGCLRQALRLKRGELLANQDVLSCGPLVPMSTDDEWARMRERYWNSILLGREVPESNGPCMSRVFFENVPSLRDAHTIVFWVGLGVAEQLFLAWAVQWLRRVGSRAELKVIQFVNVGSRNISAWSLGLLHPDMFKNHPPSKELSPQAIDELKCCWTKMMSPDPGGILSVLSGTSTHSTYLRNAARQLVERFPDHKSGLGQFDLELLKQASSHGRVVHVIANTIDDWVLGVHLDSKLDRVWYRKNGALMAA